MHKDPRVQLDSLHLQVLFHYLGPETLLKQLQCNEPEISACSFNENHYRKIAQPHVTMYTDTELRHLGRDLQQQLQIIDNGTIFSFVAEQAQKILECQKQQPVYRYEYALVWRELSKNLGQDLLITAFLAKKDLEHGILRQDFTWTGAITSDNSRLRQILRKGISENHFHLNGSVPIFFLSWVYLMNHPKSIRTFFASAQARGEFGQPLSPRGYSSDNTEFSLEERLFFAVFLRKKLFTYLEAGTKLKTTDLPSKPLLISAQIKLEKEIQALRYQYGLPICLVDHGKSVLDYAITKSFPQKSVSFHHNRIFAGERYLQYRMLHKILNGQCTKAEENIFYLYLLFQNVFYSEIIQVNQRKGFENFLYYQNRKDVLFENSPQMNQEAVRAGIFGALEDQPIRSLETRISFKNTAEKQYEKIISLDHYYQCAKNGNLPFLFGKDPQEDSLDFFYVIHFIKKPLDQQPNHPYYPLKNTRNSKNTPFLLARNHLTRKEIRAQAHALVKVLQDKPEIRKRVLGIDGCSEEIGCRPETFATEFHFLRGETTYYPRKFLENQEEYPGLRVTYHAGEDFLDLVDGLRAIDEAILFLGIRRGDRIGHALALGIIPLDFYSLKNHSVVLPTQDLLDNLVWLIFRSREFGLTLPPNLHRVLLEEAENLFNRLFSDEKIEFSPFVLESYFRSWKLRGDHPDFYFNPMKIENEQRLAKKIGKSLYNKYKIREDGTILKNLKSYRADEKVFNLCKHYHFSTNCRKKGAVDVLWEVPKELPLFLEKLQERIQLFFAENGIGIECNPSSNVLISTFGEYNKHPIFRFNNYGISHWNPELTSHHMNVSLNTDDLGVFATSLENEYTLLACCLERETKESSKENLSPEEIYDYINYLRKLGNAQSFQNDFDPKL